MPSVGNWDYAGMLRPPTLGSCACHGIADGENATSCKIGSTALKAKHAAAEIPPRVSLHPTSTATDKPLFVAVFASSPNTPRFCQPMPPTSPAASLPLPEKRSISPATRRASLVGRRILLAIQRILPAESRGLPSGSRILLAKRLVLPSRRTALPSKCRGSPSERRILPSERRVLPSVRRVLSASRRGLPARIVPAPARTYSHPAMSALFLARTLSSGAQVLTFHMNRRSARKHPPTMPE
jgi:hypothetical protein